MKMQRLNFMLTSWWMKDATSCVTANIAYYNSINWHDNNKNYIKKTIKMLLIELVIGLFYRCPGAWQVNISTGQLNFSCASN